MRRWRTGDRKTGRPPCRRSAPPSSTWSGPNSSALGTSLPPKFFRPLRPGKGSMRLGRDARARKRTRFFDVAARQSHVGEPPMVVSRAVARRRSARDRFRTCEIRAVCDRQWQSRQDVRERPGGASCSRVGGRTFFRVIPGSRAKRVNPESRASRTLSAVTSEFRVRAPRNDAGGNLTPRAWR